MGPNIGSHLKTLTPADIARFDRDGYVVVRQAFDTLDALEMEDRWWSELDRAYGVRRADRSTWRPIASDLKAAKADPIQQKILGERARGVFDDLLGEGAWPAPKDWGRTIATFPEAGAEWDVPTWFWHWDNPCGPHMDRPQGLFVVSFIGEVKPRSGGTLLLAGSPRLLIQQEARLPEDKRPKPGDKPWFAFYRSHPWLAALAGVAPSPADRIAAFMGAEMEVEGVALRVVELTGEPGDMVFCHPCMVHCGAANRGDYPRLMRIRQLAPTHEGRRRLGLKPG